MKKYKGDYMEDILNHFVNMYIQKNNIKGLPNVKISIVNNIYDEYIKTENDKWKINEIKKQKDIIENNNGMIAYPNKLHDFFIIFISEEEVLKSKENGMLVICTLWHELTHIIDYQNFVNEFNNGNFENIENTKNYMGFYFWTEYNAKKISYRMYKDFAWQGQSKSEESLEHIKNIELPFQNEGLRKELIIHQKNFQQQIYLIIHYLARYSVWEELDYNYYSEGRQFPYWLNDICNNKLLNLYNLFLKLNSFDIAKKNFDKIIEYINTLNN